MWETQFSIHTQQSGNFISRSIFLLQNRQHSHSKASKELDADVGHYSIVSFLVTEAELASFITQNIALILLGPLNIVNLCALSR
jgi:hypothetical protein